MFAGLCVVFSLVSVLLGLAAVISFTALQASVVLPEPVVILLLVSLIVRYILGLRLRLFAVRRAVPVRVIWNAARAAGPIMTLRSIAPPVTTALATGWSTVQVLLRLSAMTPIQGSTAARGCGSRFHVLWICVQAPAGRALTAATGSTILALQGSAGLV
jgi:hypothetical protein